LPKLRALIEKYVYKEIDYAFCINQKSYDFLRQQGYKGPIKVHPNGVDPHLFKPLDAVSLKEKLGLKNSRVIGYAGRFVKEKGIDTLIKAAAGLDVNYKILLLGSGPELSHLQTISREKNIDGRLVIRDVVNQEDIPRYINCMDVLVLPSITTRCWEEYFGMALIEALACGIPVIGSTCGEIPNLIGEKRLIFQEGDSNDLKMKLMGLFDNYEFWKKWAQDNIARVKAGYSWATLSRQLINTYNELIP
jgi:glycosyltransferase involved in cell wall biosynthesis